MTLTATAVAAEPRAPHEARRSSRLASLVSTLGSARSAAVVAAGTLFSRVTGLFRDAATAALLGQGVVADAFVFAWTIPNLFRAFLGDGACAGAFLPVYVARAESGGKAAARRLFRAVALPLALALAAVVLALEAGAFVWGTLAGGPGPRLLGVLAPFALLACLAALLAAVLQAGGRFFAAAAGQVIVNGVWIAGALAGIALGLGPEAAAVCLAGAIVLGGLIQLGVLVPGLVRELRPGAGPGTASQRDAPHASTPPSGAAEVFGRMGPLALGALAAEATVFIDRLVGWTFAPEGAVSGLYYANRLVQIPVAMVGLSVATAVFPALARRAAARDHRGLAEDLLRAEEQVLSLALPAAAGVLALAGPLASVFFQRGAFGASDAARTATFAGAYALGLWATAAAAPLNRALYALGDVRGPLVVSLVAASVNASFDVLLVIPLGGTGIALATAASALVAFFGARRRVRGRLASLDAAADAEDGGILLRHGVRACVLGGCVYGVRRLLEEAGLSAPVILAVGVAVGLLVHALATFWCRRRALST